MVSTIANIIIFQYVITVLLDQDHFFMALSRSFSLDNPSAIDFTKSRFFITRKILCVRRRRFFLSICQKEKMEKKEEERRKLEYEK